MNKKLFDLTNPQKSILLTEQFYQHTTINHICGTAIVKNVLNFDILKQSINYVIKTNDSFRIHLMQSSDTIKQYVSKYEEKDIEIVNLNSVNDVSILEQSIIKNTFDLFNDSDMYNFKIFKFKDNTGGFMLNIHHFIADAWTLGLTCRKIIQTYDSLLKKTLPNSSEDFSYIKYINDEYTYSCSQKFEKDKKYWENIFSNIPNIIDVPHSKNDYKNSNSCKANRESFIISKQQVEKIKEFCTGQKLSIFNFFMSILAIYIYKMTNTNNFVIGTPILNRTSFNEKNTTGMFINIVPLLINFKNDSTFLESTTKIATDSMSLLRHQRYPYAEILKYVRKQDPNFPTLFNILLSYQVTKANNVSDISYTTRWAFNGTCADDFDIQLYDLDDTGELSIDYDYKQSKFTKEDILNLHQKLLNIISEVLENPTIKINDIDLLSKKEKENIIFNFNKTNTTYNKTLTIADFFEKQAKKTPNAIAVKFENESITYENLNKKANAIASFLRTQKHISSEDFVGIMVNRSIDLISGILGIVKSGATYVAIDPEYPKERISYMLENCKAKLILVNENTENIISSLNIEKINLKNTLFSNTQNLKLISKPENLLYVIYTSGSTGTPKGVTITNQNVVNFVVGMQKIIDFSETKALVSVATVCFDMFTFEIWCSLLNGLTLVLANEDEQKMPHLLNKLCVQNNVDIFQTTPSRFKLLFDNEMTECFSHIKHILVGGEAVPVNLFKKFKQYQNIQIHHMYGPTETTVWSTHKLITDLSDITIGKPIANTQVYILDENKKVCPIGVAGTIYISGDGVGNGYLYRDDLNKKSFTQNLFIENQTMYNTGDLGYFNENGEIVYLNRADSQIKIRGFRVELDEIEKIILEFPNIKNSVVVKKILPNSAEVLCAYYISDENIDVSKLKNTLQKKLPNYMIPQYFTHLDVFPYTPNGKLDRKNLPAPEVEHKNLKFSEEPRNSTDKKLLSIASKLLNAENLQILDDLFELGMDSLIAINLSVKILNEFGVELHISDIFSHSVIKDLSDFIKSAQISNVKNTIPIAEKQDFYPLSSAQKRIYYASLVDGNNSTLYNVSGGIIFDKLPNIHKLENCLIKMLNRHESFKTYFQVEKNLLVQKIADSIDISLLYEKVDTNNIDSIFKNFIKPFSLSNAPLFRAKLVELKNKKAILIIDTHHIICDGASLNILIQDLCDLYNSKELPKLDITYKDYAVWEITHENSKEFKESENFWIEQFKGTIPVLNLPTTFPRPAIKSYSGNLYVEEINSSLANQIKNICKLYHTTPNIVLLCAYYILLHKYSGQNDIIVGTPIIGRTFPELENIVGMFVNTLPLRNNINSNALVSTFLNNIKENCSQAFSHQDYPFDTLVSKISAPRDNSRNFLFDVLFTYQTKNYTNIKFDGLDAKDIRPDDYTSKFDISLEVLPCKDNTYRLTFEYDTNLFSKDYIEKFAEHYLTVVKNVIENTNSKISEISILSDEERNSVLYSFNNTNMQYNQNKSLADLFEEQVQKTPDAIAIVFEGKELTYKEVNKKANQLAWHLKELNLGENSIIGIMLPRSLEILICMIASLKAGCCYIPIDVALPDNRIDYMLSNSNADTILTFTNMKKSIKNAKHILDVNLETSDLYNGKYQNLNLKINPESPSYIIYTSGSTGRPKGVMLKYKALTNLANYLNKNVEFLNDEYANTSMVSITTISFDIFIFETLICLQRGLKIIIANESEQNTPGLLDNLIEKYNVSCIQMTPSRMEMFLKYKELMPHLNNLKYVTLAGEALPTALRNDLVKLGIKKVYNGYGPSETTVFSTFTDVTNLPEVNIGKPLGNTFIYILDNNLQPTPVNQIGEVYISGEGVAICYVNNETITKERFLPNPFVENLTMYKTGDLAKYSETGELTYAGRIDNQVKIHGIRIELDEIEKCILKYKNIEKCILSAKKDSINRQFIVAYLVVNNRISIHNLREFLKELLPKNMIPTYFIILDEIPYLPNGKIDKKSLPEPDLNAQISENKYVEPKTKLELQIVNIFQNLLSISPIGLNDNFFELGGDSLLAVNLQIELSKITAEVTYADIFLNPTPSDLVQKIKQEKKENSENILSNEFDKYNEILENNNILPDKITSTPVGNILLTGSTGFLGSHILSEFLEKESGIAYCIIRPEAGLNTKEKLIQKLHYYFGKKYDKFIDNRIEIINMDISKNNLNSSTSELKQLVEKISCVINCAAKVAHFGQYELFKKVNVDGVETLLKFCKKYNKKFYQISTVSISGVNLGNQTFTNNVTFFENDLYIKQSLDNVYVKSKFEAEKLILDYISQGVDAYILRVGNLMNRYSDLKFQPNIDENAFINRLISFIRLKAIPEYLANEYLEFTPVDLCAESILKIVQNPTKNNRVFHLFNQNHITIKEFINVLKQFTEFNIISSEDFSKLIDTALKKKNSDKILSGIIKDFDTNKKIQYRSNISVSNDFSNKYLKKIHFEWPKIKQNYLTEFIKYILKKQD